MSLTKIPRTPTKKFFRVQTTRLAVSFDTATRSVTRTGTESWKNTAVLENFLFLLMVKWIQYCNILILTSLTWCSVLYFFLFIVHHLSTFKHCFFSFFVVSTVSSSLSFSVLLSLFCYFNILFLFMALCLFIAYSAYSDNKLIRFITNHCKMLKWLQFEIF